MFLVSEAGEYLLGYATTEGEDGYTVASRWSKNWLPEATTTSPQGAVGRSGDKRFLLDDPSSGGASGAQGASGASATAPTITLSAFKAKVAELQSEIDAGDGSEEYRTCVARRYSGDRVYRWEVGQGKQPYRFETYVDSGMPAGIQADKDGPSAPVASGYWLGGRDKDLFTVVTTTPAGRPDRVLHDVITARPLPVGEYRMNFHVLRPDELICGGWSEFVKNTGGYWVRVTAPTGTLHEAFFDPVAIGAAVGADGSNGALKPAAFTVGGASATITSLEWESGVVTMVLNPSASLAGHAVDFIALNGSVALTLSFDDATQGGGGALTWSVAAQPWNAGDLLMLRIGSDATTLTTPTPTPLTPSTPTPTPTPTSTATPTPTPPTTPTPTPTHTPTPTPTPTPTHTTTEPITVTLTPRVEGSETYVNLTIEWNDPQPCDGQYMVALYSSSDYLVTFMGFHPAPATTSLSSETYMWWDSRFFPDRWAGVSCDPSDWSGRRELGRVSLRAVHPDNN